MTKNQINVTQISRDAGKVVPCDSECNGHLIGHSHAQLNKSLDNKIEAHNIPFVHGTSDSISSVQMQAATVDDHVKVEVVPLYIWANKHACKDYSACIQQNYIRDLKLYGKEPLPFYRHTN